MRALPLAGNHPWPTAFVGAVALVAVLRFAALSSSPPGLYQDEAAHGYNAWTIAHYGTDEFGTAWPIFLRSFGDWKPAMYAYTLAPLTWFLPLTPAVERLPAATSGLLIAIFAGLAAWRISGSKPAALLTLLSAGVEPWLAIESRAGWEPVQMVLGLMIACWCLASADKHRSGRWFLGAGMALGVTVFAYASGRLFVALMTGAVLLAWCSIKPRLMRSLWVIPPVFAAYVGLVAWALQNPGALTARLQVLSVMYDNPPLLTAIARAMSNYVSYFGPPFLLTHGSDNLRLHTGYGGMVLLVTLPALIAGVWHCLQHWREAMPRFTLLALVLAPVPAALTAEGTPHPARSSTMIPFLLLLVAYGWHRLWPELRQRRSLALALGFVAIVESVGYFNDLYTQFPSRALSQFAAGQLTAIQRAHDLAAGAPIVISSSFELGYVQAEFAFLPSPAATQEESLASVGVRVVSPDKLTELTQPGDLLVLAPGDQPPPGAVLVEDQTASTSPPYADVREPPRSQPLASIWRR